MANFVQMVLLFCLLNAITILPHLTNASSKSNGAHSPPFNPSGTHATLTLNGFGRGGDGGDPSECDGKFHPLPERVVALSTGWYDNGARCGKMIRIRTKNGKTTLAKVVDECDTARGCRGNIVDASKAVWKDLGLNTDVGVVPIIWSMA